MMRPVARPLEPKVMRPVMRMRRGRRSSRTASVMAVIAFTFIVLPLVGLVSQVAWGRLWEDLTTTEAVDALRLSFQSSIAAAALACVLGLPLAWVLARVDFPGRSAVRAFTLLPMVLPPVVGGVGLLYVFGRTGFVGEWLDQWFGLQLTFSTPGVILAETFVALPFLVITVEAAIRGLDRELEEAAATLGARRATVLRRVTLPAVAPAIAAGIALAWARALGEFGATITFAGNVRGRTRTIPLAVYLLLESDPEVAIALSLVLVAISVAILTALRGRWLIR